MTTSKAAGNVAKVRDWINVKDPIYAGGAKGDGVTDDAAAIAAADTAAAAAGVGVYFPKGTYMVDITARAASIAKTASWFAFGDVTIKRKDFTTITAYYTVQENGKTGLLLEGITFDGQVTTRAAGAVPNVDLAAGVIGAYADTTNEVLWTAVFGVQIYNSTEATVRNCKFKNFLRAGLQVAGDNIGSTTKTVIDRVRIERTRSGSGGDGLYLRGGTDCKISNVHVYDYQRIGIVLELAVVDGSNCRDFELVNCTTDLGHDAVTPENNAGFWVEGGDSVHFTNCIAKRTGVGFVVNTGSNGDTGTTRSWTAPLSITNCSSLKTKTAANLRFGGLRDVHVSMTNFYGESNAGTSGNSANSPGYANTTGTSGGIVIAFVDTTVGVGCQVDLKNISLTMVDRALALGTGTEFGAIMFEQGNVSAARLFSVNIDGLKTRWLKTDGTSDSNCESLYRTSTRAHYGDIVVGGYQNAGGANDYRFRGHLRVANCLNHTLGYVMMPIEIGTTDTVIEISKTPVTLRTGLGGINNCDIYISDCPIVDLRNDLATMAFAKAKIVNSTIKDANAASTNRAQWSPLMLHLHNCRIERQLNIGLAGGDATHRKLRLVATGNEWFLPFNTESGLKVSTGAGTYAQLNMSGNAFRNNGGGVMGANVSMIEINNSAADAVVIQLSGAGNVFDANVSHVLQITTTPTFNDAPAVVAGAFLSVFGCTAVFDPI